MRVLDLQEVETASGCLIQFDDRDLAGAVGQRPVFALDAAVDPPTV